MKKGWFTHTDLTAEQATELVARYTAKHVETEKSLAPDYKSWIVSARLPESGKPPRPDKTYQWRHWE
ncbi:TPA: hypothetical protein I8271_003754 [Kluyvera intermedia]|uniref:Uncharacterized protein n=3 Tax=Enterobacteriaceae TaxID=543 RepID=A0AAC8QMH4_9ENTR|nr:hypothetical protein [Phytobacter ursingii]HAT2203365.1 hypothetical protein [Kluyvera intermedia]AKL11383.1 hypothetical protein AB182_08710 [Phytobacter ursingii]HAT2514078.1 hypothetical protein [Kluyvera intermedia]HAT2681688.1 hypothetical protein [Kluyvera intermedia]HAT2698358.1 hypothetical protein [Kluyvera intermedia]